MKTVLCMLGVLMFLISGQVAVAQVVEQFQMGSLPPDRGNLIGNGITDLLQRNDTLYLGTGFGISMSADGGETWTNYTPANYGGPGGGVSAINVSDDGTLWIAVGYDTLIDNESLQIGGGLRYLPAGADGKIRENWGFISQPLDDRNDTAGGKAPTTTRVQNITFDLALAGNDTVWISSFGGGIRRGVRENPGEDFEFDVVTTDGKPFSALANLNHRGFAATVDALGNLWIGTAEGISKSGDGGETWERFTHTSQAEPISGNFVIGLFANPADNSLWATTLVAEAQTEFNAISVTRDGGQTWSALLADELADGSRPRYVAFREETIYAATEKGVYKSVNNGQSWLLFPQIRDQVTGEGLFTSTFYSVATAPLPGSAFHRLWVGSLDGLARTDNNGFTWTVFRSLVSTRTQRSDPAVYAYPNPFSPQHSDRLCRFQFDIDEAGEALIDIYSFAMEKVVTLRETETSPAGNTPDRSVIWNGTDSNGRLVDNGVYFFRAKIGGSVTWGKVVIIN